MQFFSLNSQGSMPMASARSSVRHSANHAAWECRRLSWRRPWRGGVYGEAVHLGTQLVSVKVLEYIAAVGADGVAVGCIGAVVGIGLQLPGQDAAVLCHKAPAFSFDGVTGTGAGDSFLPADFQPDR